MRNTCNTKANERFLFEFVQGIMHVFPSHFTTLTSLVSALFPYYKKRKEEDDLTLLQYSH